MKTIKIKDLFKYAEVGMVEQLTIQEDVSGEFLVVARFKDDRITGDLGDVALETFRGKMRFFKTIDAAFGAVRAIKGFEKPIYVYKYGQSDMGFN